MTLLAISFIVLSAMSLYAVCLEFSAVTMVDVAEIQQTGKLTNKGNWRWLRVVLGAVSVIGLAVMGGALL